MPHTAVFSDHNITSRHRQQRSVNVAVAIIYYQDQYLLGYRHREQHQGDRYEFVGGKIEADESAVTALIRETWEETGIDISDNNALKLGRLHHDYGDKQVCLQVYKIELSAEQYQRYKHYSHGLEGQALTWVDKISLLDNHYSLPAANQTILSWLKLPELIGITYALADFKSEQLQAYHHDTTKLDGLADQWLRYHQQQLADHSCCYLRLKAAELESAQRTTGSTTNSIDQESIIIAQLLAARPDISVIVAYKVRHKLAQTVVSQSRIAAYHLTQNELMTWFERADTADLDLLQLDSYSDTGLIVSCHDAISIEAANQLAQLRLLHGLAPVIAIFLSPVLATQTHPDSPWLGWQQWSDLAQLADMPVIALGGLAPTMSGTATQHGASSIAGIRSFLKG